MRPVLDRIGLGVILLASATSAWAHAGGSTGYASITIRRSAVRYSLTLPISTLRFELVEAVRLAQSGSPLNREKCGRARQLRPTRRNQVSGKGGVSAGTQTLGTPD